MSILVMLLFSWITAPGYLPAGFDMGPNGPVFTGALGPQHAAVHAVQAR